MVRLPIAAIVCHHLSSWNVMENKHDANPHVAIPANKLRQCDIITTATTRQQELGAAPFFPCMA
jgi:hypothetical protein